jgi:hypothetical protein
VTDVKGSKQFARRAINSETSCFCYYSDTSTKYIDIVIASVYILYTKIRILRLILNKQP